MVAHNVRAQYLSPDSIFPFIGIQLFIILIIKTQTVSIIYIGSLIVLSITQTHNKNTGLPSNTLQILSLDFPYLAIWISSDDNINKEKKTSKILMKQWWKRGLKMKQS